MFDRNRRGDAEADDTGMDDELDKDRFATAAAAEPRPKAGGGTASASASVRDAAIIGPSIHINGDLRGEEDLLVEGTVNGTVQMRDNTLTIGSKGQVSATVYANSVYVDGKLEGDLYGSERVAIRKNGSVTGTIVSPRVSLDDGGYFKGTIEMDQEAVNKAFGNKSGQTTAAASGRGAGSETSKAGPAASADATAASSSEKAAKPSETGTASTAASAGSSSKETKGSGS